MKFILGLVLGLVIVPATAYLYFTGGSAPVATTDGDMPFERFIVRKALHARLTRDMPKNVPIELNEANYLAGAELYKQNCAVCHGVPLAPNTAIANGMYPKPPLLLVGKGVTDDPAGESYWKIKNGLRLTGMPGFEKSLSETQLWQLAVLLANADKLPPSVKTALVSGTVGSAPTPPTPAGVSGAPATK